MTFIPNLLTNASQCSIIGLLCLHNLVLIHPPSPPLPTPAPPKQKDNGLVFAQETTKGKALKFKNDGFSSKASIKTSSVSTASKCVLAVCCKNCSRNDHASMTCLDLASPPAQIYAMNADDASQTSDASSIIILAQLLDQLIERNNQPINKDFVLLDSQSTVDLFSNPAHVMDIFPADKPHQVHCNRETMLTTKQAKFGDMGIYFDSKSIVNVLFLYCLAQKYHIKYNNKDQEGVFQVITNKGVVEFKPTKKGLQWLNLQTNPDTAFLLANDSEPYDPAPPAQDDNPPPD